jgi:transcriptional regulator with XRE-family HTH domain
MLKVSEFLDKSKACAGIESDYRLAKVIGISHAAITNYRHDKNLPDEKVIQKLCELTGDDPDVISALFQSRRARTEEGRVLWMRVAQRLMTGAAAGAAAVALSGCLWVGEAAAAMASPASKFVSVCILCKVSFRLRKHRWCAMVNRFFHDLYVDVQNEKARHACA